MLYRLYIYSDCTSSPPLSSNEAPNSRCSDCSSCQLYPSNASPLSIPLLSLSSFQFLFRFSWNLFCTFHGKALRNVLAFGHGIISHSLHTASSILHVLIFTAVYTCCPAGAMATRLHFSRPLLCYLELKRNTQTFGQKGRRKSSKEKH